jgi:MraZ protein
MVARSGVKWHLVGTSLGVETVFRGRYEHAIDGKGRTSLPARYREAMAEFEDSILVATTSDDLCLRAYPMHAWREFEEKLSTKPSIDARVRRLVRHYVGNAQECPVDGMGRVLIPPSLREYAGIRKEAVFVGQIRFIEIWSKDRWEKARGEVLQLLPSDLKALADLGI